jgi:hypothetical protein
MNDHFNRNPSKAFENPIKKLERENVRLRHIAKEFHWMARRYADGRSTYATGMFNDLTKDLVSLGVELNAESDQTIFARDGMGRGFDKLTEEQATPGTKQALGDS